ncbi:hypothetical protein [Parapedomonas caeni]
MTVNSSVIAAYQRHPLVRQVARDLMTRLGEAALPIAYRAVDRMRNSHDTEGMSLWLAIHAQLAEASIHLGGSSDTCH